MRSRLMSRFLLIVCLLALCPAVAAAQIYSELWGPDGRKWDRAGRLTDFSYAGYHRGEKPLPELEPDISVRDFGAVGDGKADDTAAFKKAIEAGAGKVIHIPAGRYVITDLLEIRTSGTKLLGDGPDATVLYFPRPLNDIRPNWGATTTGQRTSNYSWSGGFILVAGSLDRRHLADVTAPAARGDTTLSVSSTEHISVGDFIRLDLHDDGDKTLTHHLYAGDPGNVSKLSRVTVRFGAKVTAVDAAAKRITIDRPLWTDVRGGWKPALYPDRSSVEEAAVVGINFEFPVTKYQGHFTEVGFNPLAMSGVRNCWAARLRITNADSGPFINGRNVTLRDILLETHRPDDGHKQHGHHGITLTGQDCLLEWFEIGCRFRHDITMSRGSSGNVVHGGKAVDLALDHHKYAPHNNLFTDIDAGGGGRLYLCGGGADLGRHTAAYFTLWNIRSRETIEWPKRGWGPDMMTIVGVRSADGPTLDPRGRWFEPIDPQALTPSNLYKAQLERRLGSGS